VKLPAKFRVRCRWLIVGLLFLIAAINNLDRQTLSVLGPTLQRKLQFSAVEYSYIVSAFLAAYTIGYSFAGRVIDRIGVKWGIALALAFWSAASAAHALAVGWITLAACRFMLGLGESFYFPGGLRAISEWVPPRERGLSIALFNNGNVVGAIIAAPVVAFLALHFGWASAFLATGGFGLAAFLLWWRFYDSPEKSARVSEAERGYILRERENGVPRAGTAPSMGRLLRHPICFGFIIGQFLTDPYAYFFSFWIPDYFQHARGFSLAALGLVSWMPYLGGDIGGPGGGALSDWLIRRGYSSAQARGRVMLAVACLMPLVANVAVRIGTTWVAMALIAGMFAIQTCWKTNLTALLTESFPREVTATLISLAAMGGSLGGIVATLLTGRAVHSYGYVPVFTVMSVLHLAAFAVIVWGFAADRRTKVAL